MATRAHGEAWRGDSLLDLDGRGAGASGPRSLTRILRILEILSEPDDGHSLADICRRLRAPRSSTFALVRPLLSLGCLIREAGIYRLGPAAFALASRILGARDADKIVPAVMRELSETTGLTIMFSEFLKDEAVVVHRQAIQSRRSIRYVATVGNKRPLLTTAAGRAVLAFSDLRWLRRYLDGVGPEANMPPRSAARQRYEAMLERVRRQGFATSLGEFTKGVGAVAAPILSAEGQAVGSIGAAGPVAEVRADLEHIAHEVGIAARTLSQSMGTLASISTAAWEPRQRNPQPTSVSRGGRRPASLSQVVARRRAR